MTEEFGDKNKWKSDRREWTVIKDLHNTMVIDFKKKIIRCSPTAWFKLERTSKLYVFALDTEGADPQLHTKQTSNPNNTRIQCEQNV